MMPDNALSTEPVPSGFVGARAGAITKTIDYEDGGIGIQDPSAGFLYQRWRARLLEAGTPQSKVLLSAPNAPEFTLIELPGLTEISISFDQNMRPVLAFMQAGTAKLRWFDPVVSAQVITEIGPDVITPRVSLDDKRKIATRDSQVNDVILAYVRGGNLYYRQQRDRYSVERLLATAVTPLIKIGFSRGLRLQFMHEFTT